MKIGVISNLESIKFISKAIEISKIENVELLNYGYLEYESVIDFVHTAQTKADALLFGGKAVYKMACNEVVPIIPWEFIDRNETSFLKGFISAMQKGYSISKITVDSCDDERLSKISMSFEDIGVGSKHIYNLDSELNDHNYLLNDYIEELCALHKDYYLNKHVDCCFTCYDNVYKKLMASKIPIFLFDYTIDEVIEKVKILKLLHSYNRLNTNEIVTLLLSIDDFREKSVIDYSKYNLDVKKIEVVKQIYVFADKLHGVVDSNTQLDKFTIYTTKKNLDVTTRNLREFNILTEIRIKSIYTISIGIGFGDSTRESRYNAVLGNIKASKIGGDCIYLVYSKDKIVGPINERRKLNNGLDIDDTKLRNISEKSHVSKKNILLLIKFKEQYSLDVVTSKELSDLFGYSLRTVNKMISQLESAGYVKIIGTKMMNDVGRPYRLIKLII